MAKDKQSGEEGGKGRNQGRYKKELYIVLCCVVLYGVYFVVKSFKRRGRNGQV